MARGMTRREMEITDQNRILEILNKSKIVHIGLVDGDEPYVIPMNYGYEMDEAGNLILYLHGAPKGRKIDVMRANPKVSFAMECDVTPFGGELACQHGTAYSSIMGRGVAEIIEDIEMKKEKMTQLMKTQVGKEYAFDDRLISIVSVIQIRVLDYTAKCRMMPPNAKVIE